MNGKMNCRLTEMFEYQKELMEKRYPQYKPGSCLNVDEPETQKVIREYAGWIMEELAEAINERCRDRQTSHDRYCEELVDGLHFIIELAIVVGYSPEQLLSEHLHSDAKHDLLTEAYELNWCSGCSFNGLVTNFVYGLGMFTHCLKNKPWEQEFQKTDMPHLLSCFQEMFGDWLSIMSHEMSANQIYSMFVKP